MCIFLEMERLFEFFQAPMSTYDLHSKGARDRKDTEDVTFLLSTFGSETQIIYVTLYTGLGRFSLYALSAG